MRSFTSRIDGLKRPGKTAPRFVQDVLCYDPGNPPSSGFNLLKDVPPAWESVEKYPELVSPNHCRHRYLTKPNQTRLRSEGSGHGRQNVYKVSAICMLCRYHLEAAVTTIDSNSARPDHPHHWAYSSRVSNQDDWTGRCRLPDQKAESYSFICTNYGCTADCTVKLYSPFLTPEWVALLTDEAVLKKRLDEALETYPSRLEGASPPSPIMVLATLRAYIDIALHDPDRNRPVNTGNRRFTTAFGVRGSPCKELLEFIGFTSQDDPHCWMPPVPVKSSGLPYEEPDRTFLDDISNELLMLMKQRPQHERESHAGNLAAEAASTQLSCLFGTMNYPRIPNFHVESHPQEPRPPYYEDLGVTADMSSKLITSAYIQQTRCDPDRAPYYFKCLRAIGHWRESYDGGEIAKFVQQRYAEGAFADDDIPDAYRFFQLDMGDKSLTDENIIGSFYARLDDSPDEAEPRRQLLRIGNYRNSASIKAVAEEHVSTMHQALVYLGADEQTPDDFIISMYTAKVNDSPATKVLAKRAVALIAEGRKSEGLQYFIRTGDTQQAEMDIGEAYRLFQISDRTIDDDSILAAYQVFASEDPAQIEVFQTALRVIANETQSLLLKAALGEDITPSDLDLNEWPVGLRNIGNTCYLNSLLQFYFTIKPFREMVLHFEDRKMEVDEESINRKKVGSRTVSRAEVERAQKFVRELRSLFEDMIKSPTRCVTPGQELARLTLLSSSNEAEIRRKSLAAPEPSLPVYGPFLPPEMELDDDADLASDDISTKAVGSEPDSGETTLVSTSDPAKEESNDDKENVGPLESSAVDEPRDSEVTDAPSAAQKDTTSTAMSPPDRPPPIPPRPAADKMRRELELGAQQDVTEVINNVLFQTQCAIKAEGYDDDGGQIDIITNLFYGKTKSYITTAAGARCKEEPWTDIKVDVAREFNDIYLALDGAFDMQKVHINGAEAEQHGTISKPPPILQIQIQRVQFDQVQMRSFKSNNHLDLKETIYLDRYMDSLPEQDLHEMRQEKWRLKQELQDLERRQVELAGTSGDAMATLFSTVGSKLRELGSDEVEDGGIDVDEATLDNTIKSLSRLEEAAYTEAIANLRRSAELDKLLNEQFLELNNLPYHLYAVFIHRGSATAGHYWIYIFDFEKEIWREYNDEQVLEVQKLSTIFAPQTGPHSPSPYFLVYVSEPMKNQLTQPVCRKVPSSNTSDPPQAEDTKAPTTRPPPAHSPLTGSLLSQEVLREDLEMPDAPPPYEDVALSNTEGVTVSAREVSPEMSPERGRNPLKRKH